MTPPTRVAIVGGGCAGLTTALELTRPEHGGRYDVTVYQAGWRLGGKGASSRGEHDRIEEHGIHLWMGCYENAFRLIREVYDEIAPHRAACPIRHWRDAFTPVTHIGLGRHTSPRGWDVWSAYFPPLPGLPGDPPDRSVGAEDPFSVVGYLTRAIVTLALLVEHSAAPPPRHAFGHAPTESEQRAWTQGDLLGRAQRLLSGGVAALRSPARILDGLRLLLALVGAPTPFASRVVLDVLDVVVLGVFDLFAARDDAHDDDAQDAMSVADVIEVVGVSMRGCIVDGVVGSPHGFTLLDDWDFRDWLVHHGASTRAVDSPFVRGMYSLMFAYEHGDPTRPRLAAGAFLRVCARMFFTYRGALFWRMAAGMGEIVFAPIYECLRRRGVRFEFFHRLDHTRLDDEGRHVAALDFTVQATTRDGAPYEPLVDVHGLPCWPAEPLWDQLESAPSTGPSPEYEAIWCEESVGTRTLEVGRDFDLVVLALGLGAVPHVCRELVDRLPRWRTMVERVQTVATQAAQLWLHPTLPELGWRLGPIMMTGFAPPFDSWGDMSNLVPWESWPADRTPGSLAYFCNVMPDGGPPTQWSTAAHAGRMATHVDDQLDALLDDELPRLWPTAIGPDGRFDRTTIAGVYLRSNTNPSDRYVLSVPGSGAARISPLDRDVENLTVAGDWTACGVDVGCIEAAVMSGMLAAYASTGSTPRTEDIVGYHHP